MADRTVKVTLVAQASGYIAGMDQAARKTRELGSEAERLAQKRAAFEGIGRGLLAIGVAAAVGVGFAIAKYVEFDQAMSQVNAVTQETVAGQNLLRDAALEAGGATVFTAKEAAEAEEELAKAGLRTADIIGGALTGSLNLAASGQLSVARSGEITAITLKQFGLDGAAAARVADVLSAGANKAVGSVEDLAQGLKFVGPVASSMNVSLEDTVATLALFADRGLIGEQAGTSLRGMLSSLTSPSKQAQQEISRLGISLYDSQGRFLGLENAAGQLSGALGGVSDAERDMSLGIIFGNNQVTAARVLVGAGAQTWREYRDAVDDSGIAARIAAERMDNLAGDVEKLGGALDTALIRTGSGANDVLRDLVQTGTLLVDWIGELPEPVLAAGLAFTVSAGAVGVLGGAALLAIPRLADLRLWMSNVGISAGGLAARVGLATAGLTAVTLVIGAVAAAQAQAKALVDEYKTSLDAATGATTQYTRAVAIKNLQDARAFEFAKQLGITESDLTDAVFEQADAYTYLTEAAQENGKVTALGVPEKQKLATALQQQIDALGDSQDAWANETAANKDATQATEKNNAVLNAMGVSAGAAANQVGDLADQIRGLADTTLSARDAERNFQAAIDDAAEAMHRNGATLDLNTEAGRENQAALDAIAKTAKEAAAAKYEQTQSEGAATKEIEAGRAALIAQLAQYGITGQAAQDYADDLGLIPSNISTLVNLNTSAAQQQLDRFIRLNNGRSVRVNARVVNGPGFAYGGPTPEGPKHQIVGVVHAGEFVSTQETLAKPSNRAALEFMHAGGDISTWRSAPAHYATAAPAQAPISLDGLRITGRLDLGNGLEGFVDGRIVAADRATAATARGGVVR
jgi:TP901 family phage tail tape measure protein